MQIIADRLKQAEARLEEMAFKSIPARLAALLLNLRKEQGNSISGYTHQDNVAPVRSDCARHKPPSFNPLPLSFPTGFAPQGQQDD